MLADKVPSRSPLPGDDKTGWPKYRELRTLVEAVYHRYGYDFRGYAPDSFDRRIRSVMAQTGAQDLASLQAGIEQSEAFFRRVLPNFTVLTSEMFRDPPFYRTLREDILPSLRGLPGFKIWHVGCGRGEEVYSLAILLRELGLAARAVVYVSDVNPKALCTAKEGSYPASAVKGFTANYLAAGGRHAFSDYYTAWGDRARFDPSLRRNICFLNHNLLTEDAFTQVQLVLCRNVLIYFERGAQARALSVLSQSLDWNGHLCLGSMESLSLLTGAQAYLELPGGQRIFRKVEKREHSQGF